MSIFVRLDDQTLHPGLDGQVILAIFVLADRGFGGAYRDRTDDPLLAKQMLSQLS